MKKPNVSIACIGPGSLVTLTYILSQIASKRCDYANTGLDAVTEQQLAENDRLAELSQYNWGDDLPKAIGLRCWQSIDGTNYKYPDGSDDFFNSSHNAARAFGIITTIFGAIAFVYFLMAICIDKLNSVTGYVLMGSLLFLTCLFECMTFVLFNSSICILGCNLDTASRCGIAACVFWFVSGVMTFAAAGKIENAGDAAVAAATESEKKDKIETDAPPKEKEEAAVDHHSSGEDTEPHDHADDVEKQMPQEPEKVEAST